MTSSADVGRNLVDRRRVAAARARTAAHASRRCRRTSRSWAAEGDKLAVAEDEGSGPDPGRAGRPRARSSGCGSSPARCRCASPTSRASRPPAWCSTRTGDAWRATTRSTCSTSPSRARTSATRNRPRCAPGRRPVCVDTPAGRLGLAVCYDLRFPELFRRLLAHGAEWFCLPSAFTAPTGRAHWETLLRARAIENLCHVVAPAQSGFHENGRETHGDSMIVDCWGRVLARLPRGSGRGGRGHRPRTAARGQAEFPLHPAPAPAHLSPCRSRSRPPCSRPSPRRRPRTRRPTRSPRRAPACCCPPASTRTASRTCSATSWATRSTTPTSTSS